MKTKSKVFNILLVSFAILLTNCSNELNSIPGSLTLKASAFPESSIAKAPSVVSTDLMITSAVVQIQNLVIEENTGEDVQGNNENNDNDNDKSNDVEESDGEDGGDLTLAGPFVLDIFSGTVFVENVNLLPGVYKKVDFDFLPGSGDTHSIVIGGNYTKNADSIPFSIIADLNSSIQLPLSGTGLTIKSGITSSISILFDINSWIKDLDLSTATITNNSITISAIENVALYNMFMNSLSSNIDVED